MKNLFKFGFLGLALTFVMASCGNTANNEEVEEAEAAVEQAEVELEAAELEAAADSLEAVADSIVDSVEDVQ